MFWGGLRFWVFVFETPDNVVGFYSVYDKTKIIIHNITAWAACGIFLVIKMAARMNVVGRVCGLGLGAFLSVKAVQTLSKHHNTIHGKEEDYELVHVQVLFRHGARTPVYHLPDMNHVKIDTTVYGTNAICLEIYLTP